MSSGRGRSWRPANKRSERDRRKRTVILLVTVLVCLIVAILVPVLLPKEPAVEFVCLSVPEQDAQVSGFPVTFDSSTSVGQQQLKDPFQALHDLNPSRVKSPAFAENLLSLKDVAKSGEKLVLYCGLEPFVELDNGTQKPVLKLRESEGATSTFSALLQVLKDSSASQILLLVDPVSRAPSLVHGDHKVDVVPLIEQAVQEAAIRNMVVICACDRQQQSWPYVTGFSDQALLIDASLAELDVPKRFNSFQGTAFAHFIREAILNSTCGSASELFQFLTDNVSPWVESTYGQSQTVLMFPQKSSSIDRELLARIQWPTEADLGTNQDDQENDTSESNTSSESESPTAESSKPQLKKTPNDLAADLRDRWQQLKNRKQISAAAPAEWMQLNAIVLSAESALRQGDEVQFNDMYSKAGRSIDQIENKLRTVASFHNGVDLAPWFGSGPASTEEFSTDSFADTFSEAFDKQTPRLFPRELSRPGIARQKFADWMIDDLLKLAEIVETKSSVEQKKLITQRSVFIQKLNELGWPKEDWPEHFFAVETVLSQADHEWHVQALKPLTRLIKLRQNILQISTGKISLQETSLQRSPGKATEYQPLRRAVWQNASNEISSTLQRLLACERWLAIGPSGYRMAMKSLDEAEASINRIKDQVQLEQQLMSVQDRQRTDLPLQIQFLAQQMEQVPLSKNELLSAETMADTILSGKRGAQEAFPAALLKPSGIGTQEIEAMFALTRSFEREAVQTEDKRHQGILDAYFANRVTAAVSSRERQRLLQIPMLIPQHGVILSGFSGDQKELIDQRQDSGIWLGFWSTRLLMAFTRSDQTETWNQWKALIAATRNDSIEEQRTARLRLMRSLQVAWNQSYSELADQLPSSLYVTTEDSAKLIGDALLQRAKVDASNRVFFKRYANRIAGRSFTAPDLSLECPELKALDENNDVSLKIAATGAKYLYVSRTELELQSPQTELQEDWYRLPASSANELVFHSSGGITVPVVIVIAAVDDAGHVLLHRAMTIVPNGRTSWQVAFLNTDGTEQVLRERDLELSPSTRDPLDPTKDQPTSLRLQITQRDGVAKEIDVQCFNLSDKPFWATPQRLILDGNNSVFLPLSPAAGGQTDASPAVPLLFDVTNGFRIEITPVNVIGAETTSIPVLPKLAVPSKFAVRPVPEYDPIRQELSFQIDRVANSGIASRQKVPVQVHFSPALEILKTDSGSPTSVLNLPERGQVFRYEFDSGIRQSFSLNPQHPEQSELEFSVSVAGIPQAWRWRLTENGIRSMSDDEFFVRGEIKVANLKEAVPVANRSKIIIGENWKQAKLDANVFLHGGNFSGDQQPWKLDLRVENMVNRQQISVLSDPIDIQRRWNQSVTIAPGEAGAWNFSITSQPYGIQGLQLPLFGLQDGSFDLIVRLTQGDNRDQAVEHRTPFVFDGTGPVISQDDIQTQSEISVTQDLKGTITASDLESDVIGIRIGMSEDKLSPVRIDQGAETSGEFTIRAAEKSFPVIRRSEQTEYADADLIAEITNGAGLKTLIKKRLTFSAAALPMKKAAAQPAKPGSVIFIWPTQTKYKVTLEGPKAFKKVLSGSGSVEFADVPPGKYRLKWDAGFGPRDHPGSLSVRSGQTTSVEK